MKKCLLVFLLIPIFLIPNLLADDKGIDDKLSQCAKENGKNYIQPFATAFGTNLNSGWFQTAKIPKPFLFGFTLNSMVAFIPGDAKTFMATNPDTSLYQGDKIETATVFGGDGGTFWPTALADTAGIGELTLPDGINLDVVPLVMPQVFVGLPAGFEIAARFCPPVELSKDVGKLTMWGLGAKYQASKLIPLCPVAIAVQGTYQQLKLGDIITCKSTFLNAQVSKGLVVVPITLYGGIGAENTTITAKYDYTYQTINGEETKSIKFNINGENEFRVTAGVKVRLLLFDICADYSIGNYPVARLGLGVSL